MSNQRPASRGIHCEKTEIQGMQNWFCNKLLEEREIFEYTVDQATLQMESPCPAILCPRKEKKAAIKSQD